MSDSLSSEPTPGPSLEGRGESDDGEIVDPEIVALLEFEAVPRKIVVKGGWAPDKQREFIVLLAGCGSPGKACEVLGMDRGGVRKLYNNPDGASFRAAWDGAVALAERRRAEESPAEYVGPDRRPPSLDNRRRAIPPPTPPHRGEGSFDDEPDPDEEQKWELIHNIGVKFMRKVAAEREARLAGEIVAADFYLRQITFLEMTFDLTATAFGWDAGHALKSLQRCGHRIMDIVSTPLADWLDRARRLWWLQEGEPDRPPHPDVRFLKRHGDEEQGCSTYVDQHATGATTTPARGYTAEEWAAMNRNEQLAARQRQYDEDAAEQLEYERRAHEEWRERNEES